MFKHKHIASETFSISLQKHYKNNPRKRKIKEITINLTNSFKVLGEKNSNNL